MSENTENKIRSAIENSLQGLAFWMGYRNTICYGYVFNEYSLVEEFSFLLKSLLGKEYTIKREELYSKHFPGIEKGDRMDLFITDKKGDRMDLLITDKNGNNHAVIEVKRWRKKNITNKEGKKKRQYTRNEEIEKDINRLAAVKKGNNIQCFFILISEKARPAEYVGENGNAVKKRKDCKDLEHSIRILKASSSFQKKENAYYCCLIEILKKQAVKNKTN